MNTVRRDAHPTLPERVPDEAASVVVPPVPRVPAGGTLSVKEQMDADFAAIEQGDLDAATQVYGGKI